MFVIKCPGYSRKTQANFHDIEEELCWDPSNLKNISRFCISYLVLPFVLGQWPLDCSTCDLFGAYIFSPVHQTE